MSCYQNITHHPQTPSQVLSGQLQICICWLAAANLASAPPHQVSVSLLPFPLQVHVTTMLDKRTGLLAAWVLALMLESAQTFCEELQS